MRAPRVIRPPVPIDRDRSGLIRDHLFPANRDQAVDGGDSALPMLQLIPAPCDPINRDLAEPMNADAWR
jgi:hypothetical protein